MGGRLPWMEGCGGSAAAMKGERGVAAMDGSFVGEIRGGFGRLARFAAMDASLAREERQNRALISSIDAYVRYISSSRDYFNDNPVCDDNMYTVFLLRDIYSIEKIKIKPNFFLTAFNQTYQ
jgi:hypothetical protein